MLSAEIEDNAPKSLEKSQATAAPASAPEPLPRKFERFTLLSRVARGGMGEVYLATAQGIEGAERPLIVKIVRPDHADDRSFVARFLDEARIQAQLSHPGVAQILEASADSHGKPYVVVEYVEGKNLSDVRSRTGQLGVRVTWPEAMALGICLGEALAHVHERTDADGRPLDIVHRDLSPQNVMVGYGGELKVIDFGTARGQNRRCQTVAGIVFAKPGYVAPEVANNAPGGVPADLYAFGVILWELLAGRRFLSGEASQHMAAVGAGKRTLPPLARLIGAPPEVDSLLARLTATSIEARYPSARAALADIVKLLQRAPSLADGDRSVRGRIADLMHRLYPAEPARSRADFARRVAEARALPAPEPLPPPPSPEPPESSDPSVLAGTRYRLTREIGRGAMGVVHEAVHVDLGRTVAVKLLGAEAMSPLAQSRFRAEARAIAAIDHENLVKIYDFGACNDGRLYYAMELLEGESLDKRMAREPRVPEKVAVDLGILACRALEAAHRAGVVHRDIKPANLFLTRNGSLKVLDFGVAKSGAEASPVTVSDELYLLGTPEYMAPEQARGEADARSDVYALGTVLYELVTGSLPFDGEGPLAILAQKSAKVPEAPSSRAPGACSQVLDRVLLRALDPEPSRRHEDIAALRRDLATVLLPRTAQPPRRRRLGVAALSFTVAGCLTVLVAAGAQNVTVRDAFQGVSARLSSRVAQVRARLARGERTTTLAGVAATSPAPGPKVAEVTVGASAAGPLVAEANDPRVDPPAADEPDATESDPQDENTRAELPTQGEKMARAEQAEQPAQAEQEQRPAVKPAVEAALAEASALTLQGRELRALELLRKAAERNPKEPLLLRALASALAKNRSWGEAVRVARRGAEVDPSPETRLELARLERATGHRERAVAILQRLVQDERAGAAAREMLRGLTGNDRVALRD
jgi:serine/threonine-protein kinase